ncbi:MAG: YceH family protein [Proteobacteria bacterium]|nr:YceH family protein [Pseudomonadota bacterium]
MRLLTPLEARVLGVLVEKQSTVPDTYPLSLNALASGCNQKTAREPVLEASDADLLMALDGLKALALVFETSGGRVVRYEHNMARVLRVPSAAVALLATLMLRGPQTAAQLRLNCERLHRFADVSSVEGFLDELAGKEQPLAARLARAAGEREARWAHLLCGEPALPAVAATAASATGSPAAGPAASVAEFAALEAEQKRLAARLEALESLVQRLARELGMS